MEHMLADLRRLTVLRETKFGSFTYKRMLQFYVKHRLALLRLLQGGSFTCKKLFVVLGITHGSIFFRQGGIYPCKSVR